MTVLVTIRCSKSSKSKILIFTNIVYLTNPCFPGATLTTKGLVTCNLLFVHDKNPNLYPFFEKEVALKFTVNLIFCPILAKTNWFGVTVTLTPCGEETTALYILCGFPTLVTTLVTEKWSLRLGTAMDG